MLFNLDNYCQVFGMQKLPEKHHPENIYVQPESKLHTFHFCRWLGLLCACQYDRLRFRISSSWDKKAVQMEKNEFHNWFTQALASRQLHSGQCSSVRKVLLRIKKRRTNFQNARCYSEAKSRLTCRLCAHQPLQRANSRWERYREEALHLLPC